MKTILLVNSYTGKDSKIARLALSMAAEFIPKDISYKKIFVTAEPGSVYTANIFNDHIITSFGSMSTDVIDFVNYPYELNESSYLTAENGYQQIADNKSASRLLGVRWLLSESANEDTRNEIKTKANKIYAELKNDLSKINDGEAIIVFGSRLLIASLLIIAMRQYTNDSDQLSSLSIDEIPNVFPFSECGIFAIDYDNNNAADINELFDSKTPVIELLK